MQGCNKELSFLREEQDKIKRQDWSDRMVDPPDVRRQYEVRVNVLLKGMSCVFPFLSVCYVLFVCVKDHK